MLFLSFVYPQNIREVQIVKETITEKLPINFNKQFNKQYKISASALNESFEDATFPPNGWITFLSGGTGWSRETSGTELPGWSLGNISTPSGGGNAVAYCTWNDTTTFNDQWLISPQIQNIQTNDTLFFWLRNQKNFADTVYIYYSTGDVYNLIGRIDYSSTSDTNWGKWFVTIGQVIPTGSNVFIGFREYVEDNSANGGAISLDMISISTPVLNYPTSINISKSFTFGDPTQSTSYRMIGLPGNGNFPISNFTSGSQKKDWNVFYDDGSEPINLLEFNGQATFNFRPGKGFWALSRNPINVPSQQVNSVNLTGNAFPIALHNGWNIISNPFEKNVNVADIRTANGLPQNAIFHNFTGTFPTGGSTVLTPYEGYYFFNDGTHPNLNIPYPFTGTIEKINTYNTIKVSEQSLKISLVSKNYTKDIIVGIDPSSSNDFDELDYFAPPSYFEDISINLVNQNLSVGYKNLFIENRPEIGEGQVYNLRIKNTSDENVTLLTEGLNNFNDYEIILLDKRLKKFYDLKNNAPIVLSSFQPKNEFDLVIGTKAFVEKQKSELQPLSFELYQNYPNPFNPSTVITFEIPQTQFVNIRIYNELGELVKILINGIYNAGKYEIQWDGNNDNDLKISSGVYFYSLETDGKKLIKKMMMTK